MNKNHSSSSETLKEAPLKISTDQAANTVDSQQEDLYVSTLIQRYGDTLKDMYPVLQDIQYKFGCLPDSLLESICCQTDISAASLVRYVSCIPLFRRKRSGKFTIAFYAASIGDFSDIFELQKAFRQYLRIPADADTDDNQIFTLENEIRFDNSFSVPFIRIGEINYTPQTPIFAFAMTTAAKILADFIAREKIVQTQKNFIEAIPNNWSEIRIPIPNCVLNEECQRLYYRIQDIVRKNQFALAVKLLSCSGHCHSLPRMELLNENGISIIFANVSPDNLPSLLFSQCSKAIRWPQWINSVFSWWDSTRSEKSKEEVKRDKICPFLPSCSSHFPCIRGQSATSQEMAVETFRKLLQEQTPDTFFKKWEAETVSPYYRDVVRFLCQKKAAICTNNSKKQYLHCRCQELDPNSNISRILLEFSPFSILEGMMITAFFLGINRAVISIPVENRRAFEQIKQAITSLKEKKYLGEKIANTDFSLDISLEEDPINIPVSKLNPGDLSNDARNVIDCEVELMVQISKMFQIQEKDIVSEKKYITLAGKLQRTGLVEIPSETSLQTVIEDFGGGTTEKKKIKAVLIGGASGRILSPEKFETVTFVSTPPVSVDERMVDIQTTSNIMTSNIKSVMILEEGANIIETVRDCLFYYQQRSCGQCTFCRIGTKRLLEILNRFCMRQGRAEDLPKLEALAYAVQAGSRCNWGKNAPSTIISSLQNFRAEYEKCLEKDNDIS